MQRQVIFILGGPGAGKSTEGRLLARAYGALHISAGDCLRAEAAKPGSELAGTINDDIRNGRIVDGRVTTVLLHRKMLEHPDKRLVFIDGYPRSVDNYETFIDLVGSVDLGLIVLDCADDVLRDRIQQRILSGSTRADDNPESFVKRMAVFKHETRALFQRFETQGRLHRVQSTNDVDETHRRVQSVVDGLLKAAEPAFASPGARARAL
ncbi:Adenylate kinase/UMP-CMP kinase [Giardia muris]|uniref:Adenylate kinase/UMP-CMP kinase n=1 Tax=Giardia muris TaxID=5742 RepID=A0A4Z1T1M7_GIAMU|nr:Adenylate kinase/UMP-CMP kinase [Giardia muris]|eukprot:TNJ26857.1 Adenylate kinase/UMP-CMP kinase [Giardia muris]